MLELLPRMMVMNLIERSFVLSKNQDSISSVRILWKRMTNLVWCKILCILLQIALLKNQTLHRLRVKRDVYRQKRWNLRRVTEIHLMMIFSSSMHLLWHLRIFLKNSPGPLLPSIRYQKVNNIFLHFSEFYENILFISW